MAKKPRPRIGFETLAVVQPTKPPQLKALGGSDRDGFSAKQQGVALAMCWLARWPGRGPRRGLTASNVSTLVVRPVPCPGVVTRYWNVG